MYESPKTAVGTDRAQTEIEQVCQALNSHNELLSMLACRLDSMRERLFGPAPKDPGKAGAPSPSGVSFVLRDALTQQRALIERSKEALLDIEKFS